MFEHYFLGMQQDLKLAVLPPLLCAVFRAVFIYVYSPKESWQGQWKKLYHCFRYGFWWGMDWNAYAYLVPLALVTLPGMFFAAYYEIGNIVRAGWIAVYAFLLYFAFWGKMIFYYHYHDIYNRTIWLGKNADKKNLADIFFNQNHGAWILMSFIPYLFLCFKAAEFLLGLPTVTYPAFDAVWKAYAFNTSVFLGSIAIFYWFRFGGTFRHRLKPEWDEVPLIVKQDIFLSKATVDDFVALETVLKHPADEALSHTDEESQKIMAKVTPDGKAPGEKPLEKFVRTAKGALIQKPSHIFFLFGESHAQAPFDNIYDKLNLMEASQRFRQDKHTISFNNFLPGGMISQPSLVSLMAGIYDADMELNENKDFWYGNIPSSMPLQLKKLGYRTEFWYGGGLNWGSLEHFAPAIGFDECHGGPDICGPDAPKTWLGVYDHLFLEEAARRIKADSDNVPAFHFLYTTSNHGPYLMPYDEYGFDIERVMPEAPQALKKDKATWRRMAGIWYADQALIGFVETMKEAYPDALFIVTGDHSAKLMPFEYGIIDRREPSLRDQVLTSFAMYHREIDENMFADNTIGGHMNIMPTVFELIAHEGFSYYGLMPPLTERIDHVVTPYCWMTDDTVGMYKDRVAQSLEVSPKTLKMKIDTVRFEEEMLGWSEITAWIVKHPEILDDAGRGKRV
ncbi:MAG: LTA synthase family protein [Schwartzia sp.]|nr:LTA synthase family protein [Schwartzia sp. (in: firmicutes)]